MSILFVAGMNHRSAPVEVREQLALPAGAVREILAELVVMGGCREVMILSTCNRVEVYGVAGAPSEARDHAFRALASGRGPEVGDLESHLYTLTGADAIRHVFRVASSLDSMVLGEPQILGQLKEAFALAQASDTVGPVLHAVCTQAFSVAKRVRSETEVGRHAVSVSLAGVELARKIFGSLAGRAVLLIGAGEMGELAAKHLRDHGTLPIAVANRTHGRAVDLARTLGGTAIPFECVPAVMESADIVITCTGAQEPILRAADVRVVRERRVARPLFLIDLAVPRNIESSVNELDGVFCYDIDDLRSVVESNVRERQYQAQRAGSLVEREVPKLTARLRDLEVVPTIVSLREKLEAIRRAEVQKALSRLPHAGEETRQVIDALSQAIVNKVLHVPILKLRASSRDGRARRWTTLISEVFGLSNRAGPERERGRPEPDS
jgi:glutamyl-tRNA reductase